MRATSYSINCEESSTTSSWESESEALPMPKMVRTRKVLQRKRAKLYVNEKKDKKASGGSSDKKNNKNSKNKNTTKN